MTPYTNLQQSIKEFKENPSTSGAKGLLRDIHELFKSKKITQAERESLINELRS